VGLLAFTTFILATFSLKPNAWESKDEDDGRGDEGHSGMGASTAASAITLSEEACGCTNKPEEEEEVCNLNKSGNDRSGLLSSSPSCYWLSLKTSDKH
jgi:hypothetical protein